MQHSGRRPARPWNSCRWTGWVARCCASPCGRCVCSRRLWRSAPAGLTRVSRCVLRAAPTSTPCRLRGGSERQRTGDRRPLFLRSARKRGVASLRLIDTLELAEELVLYLLKLSFRAGLAAMRRLGYLPAEIVQLREVQPEICNLIVRHASHGLANRAQASQQRWLALGRATVGVHRGVVRGDRVVDRLKLAEARRFRQRELLPRTDRIGVGNLSAVHGPDIGPSARVAQGVACNCFQCVTRLNLLGWRFGGDRRW